MCTLELSRALLSPRSNAQKAFSLLRLFNPTQSNLVKPRISMKIMLTYHHVHVGTKQGPSVPSVERAESVKLGYEVSDSLHASVVAVTRDVVFQRSSSLEKMINVILYIEHINKRLKMSYFTSKHSKKRLQCHNLH